MLRSFPLKHPGTSLGFRLDWPGHSLAYVTDTTASADASYIQEIRGVDLLLHEAYFADDAGNLPEITGHSSLPHVVRIAADANVGRLVLVHVDPKTPDDSWYDLAGARRVFANTQLGSDCMEVEF
jgi:ribonuclease BN (tRNA processing enzyme)